MLHLVNDEIACTTEQSYVVSYKGVELTDPMTWRNANAYLREVEPCCQGLEVTPVRWRLE